LSTPIAAELREVTAKSEKEYQLYLVSSGDVVIVSLTNFMPPMFQMKVNMAIFSDAGHAR
jgi:hypothetical protein